MQRWGLTQSASRCSTRDRRPHRSSFTRNVKVGQPRRGNSPIPTSLWFCDVRVGILTFDRWITAPISLDLYEGRVGHASPFLAWPGMFSPPQLCHPDRNRSSSQSDDLWSGGPCVLTSPGCEEQWGSSRNRRKRTTETALPARCSRWDCERYVDVATTTLRGDTAPKPDHHFFVSPVSPAGPGGT